MSASRLCSRSFVRSEPEDESLEKCSTAEAVDCASWVRIRLSLDEDKFLSWTVVHIPGAANLAANILKARYKAFRAEVVCSDCNSDLEAIWQSRGIFASSKQFNVL